MSDLISQLAAARETVRRLEVEVAALRCTCGHRYEDHHYMGDPGRPGCSVEVDRYEKCSCMRFKRA